MNSELEILPLSAIKSESAFVVCSDRAGKVISEHRTAAEAVRALVKHVRENKASFNTAAIYQRKEKGWKKF